MMANPRVLGYLGRALSHELSAVQQYMTHARLAELWGMEEPAKTFREEVVGELQHAERLTGRMLELGAIPNASQLKPTRAGVSLLELLEADRELELQAVQLYQDAAHYCALINDPVNGELFTELMNEELEHARELEGWIQQLRNPVFRPAMAAAGA